MKKILITFSAITLFATVQAQKIGVQVAGLLTSEHISANGLKFTSDSRAGWKVGIVSDIALGPIHFMPQVNVLSKGGKYNTSAFTGVQGTETHSLTYVEVPLLVSYKFANFFFGAGPSFAFGIGGKYKITSSGQTEEVTIKFDGNENGNDEFYHYKSTDIGLQLIAGVMLPKGFFVNAHYNFGLSNTSPDTRGTDAKQKSGYLGLAVGKFFGK